VHVIKHSASQKMALSSHKLYKRKQKRIQNHKKKLTLHAPPPPSTRTATEIRFQGLWFVLNDESQTYACSSFSIISSIAAPHTHTQPPRRYTRFVGAATLSPVHNGSCARSSNSWPSYKCLDFASSRNPHRLRIASRTHTNPSKQAQAISRSRLRRHNIKK